METILALIYIAAIITIFLIPSIIAFVRGHASKLGITVTNILFGITGIGWVVALIWSLSNKGQSNTTVVNVGSGNSYNISQKDSL